MRKDAEEHAEEDKSRRELVDLKNQGDAMAYGMEKMLAEQGEKVSAEDRAGIESAMSSLRDALKGDDAESIKRAMENLEKASHKAAEEMYKGVGPDAVSPEAAAAAAAEGQQEAPPAEQAPPDGDDVIDAEYEVKE